MEGVLVPVTLITGFLGSGKTTLLHYILNNNHGKRIAVIQNEFGPTIEVESALVQSAQGGPVDEWLELPNGCLCCTMKDGLVATLEKLIERKKGMLDHILVESTGMADPGPVASIFWVDSELGSTIYLDSIITVVDAKHILLHIENEIEAQRQIAFADVIVLNKMDLITKKDYETVLDSVKSVNSSAIIFPTERSVVSLDSILNIKAFNPDPSRIKFEETKCLDCKESHDGHSDSEHSHHNHTEHDLHRHTDSGMHTYGVSTISVDFSDVSFDLGKINRWLGNLVWKESEGGEDGRDQFWGEMEVYRYKAMVNIYDSSLKYCLQGVHTLFSVDESTIKWGDGEKRNTRFVFIGKKLDRNKIETTLKECYHQ
eukprot:TRINITY_DN3633_c0_g1_i1.p1 TRINITY_DN3633_c0_g1~~TRINITY_DN3633_c0_g1_i1.p1  ORF type:complete len:371 (+),score=45.58 TRINITY_DN3633_c0_g1_i1:997-2109(+)